MIPITENPRETLPDPTLILDTSDCAEAPAPLTKAALENFISVNMYGIIQYKYNMLEHVTNWLTFSRSH